MKLKNIVTIVLIVIICSLICSTCYAGAVAPEDRSGYDYTPPTGENPYAPGQVENPTQGDDGFTGTKQPPAKTPSGSSAGHTPDEIITEGQNFINTGKGNGDTTLNGWNIRAASNTIYNILLSIGIVVATCVGAYLGLKFIMASAEDKAQVKESLIPFIVGCIIIFSAFAIWKLALTIMSGLDKVSIKEYNIEYTVAKQIDLNKDFNIFS